MFYQHPHILQGDGMAFDNCESHISASYHRPLRIEHPQANMADSSNVSCHTCKASLVGTGISDTAVQDRGSYAVSLDGHSSLAFRNHTDKEAQSCHRVKEAAVSFDHSDSLSLQRQLRDRWYKVLDGKARDRCDFRISVGGHRAECRCALLQSLRR